jgi:hypothetical protein
MQIGHVINNPNPNVMAPTTKLTNSMTMAPTIVE